MSCGCLYLFGFVVLLNAWCHARNVQCPELSGAALKAILGTTYNPRYMSIQAPMDDGTNTGRGPKRASAFVEHDFYMDGEFEENLYEGIPAWEVDHVEIALKKRKKRTAPQSNDQQKTDARDAFIANVASKSKRNVFQSRPWECKSEIQWIDLGVDYFPRYLRSVECKKTSCWYGHYSCKPKRFSVKVLRRSTGQCAKVSQRLKLVALDTVTGEYAQQWEFEEKPVTFCCDCTMNY